MPGHDEQARSSRRGRVSRLYWTVRATPALRLDWSATATTHPTAPASDHHLHGRSHADIEAMTHATTPTVDQQPTDKPRRIKPSNVEGMAALQAAETKLAVLTQSPATDEVVHRVLPPNDLGTNPVEDLERALAALRFHYAPDVVAWTRKQVWGFSISVALGTVLAFALAFGLASNWQPFAAVIATLAICGPLMIGALQAIDTTEQGARFMSPREAIALIDTADLSALVVLANPDEATALVLDRAATHAKFGPRDLKAAAYEHYFTVVCAAAAAAH